MFKSCEELRAKIGEYTAELESKFNGVDGKRYVMLCGGTGCVAGGTMLIKEKFEELIKEYNLEDKVAVRVVGCFGLCSQGPFVRIFPEDVLYRLVKPTDIEEIVLKDLLGGKIVDRLVYQDPQTGEKITKMEDIAFYRKQKRIALHGCGVIDPNKIEEALGCGGYQGLMNALSMPREDVIKLITDSGLRGRGGGGFPTGKKWQFAYNSESDQKYVVCNGDEGDPGAFMDRSVLEDNPLAVIEGMAIAGYAIGASEGYFYIRAEYPVAVARVNATIAKCEELGLLGDNILGTGFSFHAHVRLGAGAFVCGEETALLNSIMGQRGMPRPRPPFPAVKGLWDKPTIVNNVETLATVPYILREGLEAFTQYGTERSKGTKVFCLGGKVNNVGLVEIPMGITLRELIYEIGGGIQNGKQFKAIQTGGPSGGCLTSDFLDTPIDFDNMVEAGSMMGSGGAIVMDEDNCMVDVAKFYMGFICDESCGKCSPCRIGTKRMMEILDRITGGTGTMKDFEELEAISQACRTNALCALGQTASNPIMSTIEHFKDEYIAHIQDKKCPAKVCKDLIQYTIIADKCKMCSLCSRQCGVEAISGTPGKTPYVIDQNKCVKCGMCLATCKFGAIIKE
ncbi:MAG: NADH-ubiquinone oxidoreductase-F iron-sulfur binding region domain-containing protein [Oscillospiraceae bacterium]